MGEVTTAFEHRTHGCSSRRIEMAEVECGEAFAAFEHIHEALALRRDETAQVDVIVTQALALAEHERRREHLAAVEILPSLDALKVLAAGEPLGSGHGTGEEERGREDHAGDILRMVLAIGGACRCGAVGVVGPAGELIGHVRFAAVQLEHSLAAVLSRLLAAIVIERERAVVIDGIAL